MNELSLETEALLKNELISASHTNEELTQKLAQLSPSELGHLFISSLFLRSVLKPLIDEDWLGRNRGDSAMSETRAHQMINELRSLSFLTFELVNASPLDLKTYFNRVTHFIHILVSFIQGEPPERFRETASSAMKVMDARARELDLFPHNVFTEAMYRAFDAMDEVLGIRYELDHEMVSDPAQRERLYEGAGIGVQTSYSSILLALERAKIPEGARVLDLGSGYGRVGFVIGLLRPDLAFTGYEYVDHRVLDSKEVCKRIGLSNVEFETRDLSTFELPRADVFYMYDPFSKETYSYVLNQLIAYGAKRPVTIITKGRANTWVRDALSEHGWDIDDTCDSGTVSLFRSPLNVSV